MGLQKKVMEQMKAAMKSKDSVALESLRAIKSALLLLQTESGSKEAIDEATEIKLLQKLVKQRKDSASLYTEQGRADLAEPELAQAAVIAKFLPEQLSEEKITDIVSTIITKVGADGMKDMGKVMGLASKEMAGSADGKTISKVVKELLSK